MTLDPDDLLAVYEDRRALLIDLGPRTESLLRELLIQANLPFHSVSHRVKSRASLRRKISDPDTTYRSLDEIHDLLGVRVITYFKDEVDRVAELVLKEFNVLKVIDKRELLDADRFGYLSLHHIAQLSESRQKLTEYLRFSECVFEVQMRSILQHTWAEIEHDLGYQTEQAIPKDLRRRFSLLAAQLEAADDQFVELRKDLDNYRDQVANRVGTDTDVGIDQDSVAALIRQSAHIRDIDDYIGRVDGRGVHESDAQFAGRTARELQLVGYESVSEVEEILKAKDSLIRAFVRAWLSKPPMDSVPFPRGISLFYLAYVTVASEGVDAAEAYLAAADIGSADRSLAEDLVRTYHNVADSA